MAPLEAQPEDSAEDLGGATEEASDWEWLYATDSEAPSLEGFAPAPIAGECAPEAWERLASLLDIAAEPDVTPIAAEPDVTPVAVEPKVAPAPVDSQPAPVPEETWGALTLPSDLTVPPAEPRVAASRPPAPPANSGPPQEERSGLALMEDLTPVAAPPRQVAAPVASPSIAARSTPIPLPTPDSRLRTPDSIVLSSPDESEVVTEVALPPLRSRRDEAGPSVTPPGARLVAATRVVPARRTDPRGRLVMVAAVVVAIASGIGSLSVLLTRPDPPARLAQVEPTAPIAAEAPVEESLETISFIGMEEAPDEPVKKAAPPKAVPNVPDLRGTWTGIASGTAFTLVIERQEGARLHGRGELKERGQVVPFAVEGKVEGNRATLDQTGGGVHLVGAIQGTKIEGIFRRVTGARDAQFLVVRR